MSMKIYILKEFNYPVNPVYPVKKPFLQNKANFPLRSRRSRWQKTKQTQNRSEAEIPTPRDWSAAARAARYEKYKTNPNGMPSAAR